MDIICAYNLCIDLSSTQHMQAMSSDLTVRSEQLGNETADKFSTVNCMLLCALLMCSH